MARLIVDLKNKDNQLYDSCGNVWVYNGSNSNIPTDCIIPGPESGTYGFMTTNANTRFIYLNSRGTIWNQSADTMTEFTTVITYKSTEPSGWNVLINPDIQNSSTDQGFALGLTINNTPPITIYKVYPGTSHDGMTDYVTFTDSDQVENVLKDNSIWHELWITFTSSKVTFYVNRVNIGYIIPQIHPCVIRKGRGFILGTWWYNPPAQTRNIEYYSLQVYEGLRYPPVMTKELKLY